jgi:hypothetical protein
MLPSASPLASFTSLYLLFYQMATANPMPAAIFFATHDEFVPFSTFFAE